MKNEELFREASRHRCVFSGIQHKYILDNGCKMELYDDGTAKFYCTVGGNYFYKELGGSDIHSFYDSGFDVASLKISIREIDAIIRRLERRNSTVRMRAYEDIKSMYVNRLSKQNADKNMQQM